MRKIVLLLCAVAFLTSCIGIESRLVLRSDGSGTLDLNYRISQLVADLGRSGSAKGVMPLPVTREDFQRGTQGAAGVTLTGFSRSENEKDITIRAQLAFNRIESLAALEAFREESPRVTVSGVTHTYTQLVVKAADKPVSKDSMEMVDTFFDGYKVSLSVETPLPIKSFTLGKLSSDKKTLTFEAPVRDLVAAEKDVVLSLSW